MGWNDERGTLPGRFDWVGGGSLSGFGWGAQYCQAGFVLGDIHTHTYGVYGAHYCRRGRFI